MAKFDSNIRPAAWSTPMIWEEMKMFQDPWVDYRLEATSPKLTMITPTRLDWEQYRPLIIEQYIQMNMQVPQLVDFMRQNHGFKATARMFKQRFKEWNVFKYPKAAQRYTTMASSLPTEIESQAIEEFPLHSLSRTSTNRTFSPSRIEKQEETFLDGEGFEVVCNQPLECYHRYCIATFFATGGAPHAVLASLFASPMLNVSSLLHISPSNGSVEEVLFYVSQFSQLFASADATHQAYIHNAAEEATKITSRIVGHCAHKSSPTQCERCTWAEFDYGLAMLEAGQMDLAFTSFELGCRLAGLLLSSPSKLFIRNLLMAFGSNRWEAHEPIRHVLLRYLAMMASLTLPPNHPITKILENTACGETLKASAEFSLRAMIDIFEASGTPADPDVLLVKRSLSVILRRQGEHQVGEELLLTAIGVSEAHNGDQAKETRRCLRRLAHLYMEQERFPEAEDICLRILDTSPSLKYEEKHRIPDEISVYTYQHLAQIANGMGDVDKCHHWFSQELDAALKRWGPQGQYSAECVRLAFLQYNLTPDSLSSVVEQYPWILQHAQVTSKGRLVISKARWCAIRNLI